MRRFKAVISFILVVSIYLGGLSPIGLQMVAEANAQATRGKTTKQIMNTTPANGLKFRLSEGAEGAEKRTTTPPAPGDPLSQGDTDNLLKRIPPPKVQDDDQKDFAKRDGSLPPPKTGKRLSRNFLLPINRELRMLTKVEKLWKLFVFHRRVKFLSRRI